MLQRLGQFDFSGGIFRSFDGGRAPDNAAHDIENLLIDDDGSLFRRGGTSYDSANVMSSGDITGIAPVSFVAGTRTVVWNALWMRVYAPAGSLITSAAGVTAAARSRVASVNNMLVFRSPVGSARLIAYAGSLKAADYSAGTVTFTNGSTAVTGVGTAFLANVDAGMILHYGGTYAVVKSVASDTQLTLVVPWSAATAAGVAYSARAFYAPSSVSDGFSAVGSAAQRLLMGIGNRVYFTARNSINFTDFNDFHEFPANSEVRAIEGLGDSALVFTSRGVYRIDNLALDEVDDSGNVQHSVNLVNKDVVLLSEAGLVSFAGGVIVPTEDNVVLMGGDGSVRVLSEGIEDLYRSYSRGSYSLGHAAVFNGHYILPIVANDAQVATLCCRLDRGAWTRLSSGAGAGFAVRGTSLVSHSGTRVLDASGMFTPTAANKLDASGAAPPWSLRLRPFQAHPFRQTLWKKLRVKAQLEDAASDDPTIAAAYDEGATMASSTALSGSMSETTTEDAFSWTVNKRAQSMSAVLSGSSASADLRIRGVEWAFRPIGKP